MNFIDMKVEMNCPKLYRYVYTFVITGNSKYIKYNTEAILSHLVH